MRELERADGGARCIDIAAALKLSKPSVHNMMDSFVKSGLVCKNAYGMAYFTEAGREVAAKVCEILCRSCRHAGTEFSECGRSPRCSLPAAVRDSVRRSLRRSAKICRLSEKQTVCKPDGACVFVNAIGIQMQIGSCVNQRAAVGEARLRLNRERKEKVAGTLAGRNKHIQIFIVKCNHPRIACAGLQTNIQGGIIHARAVFQC